LNGELSVKKSIFGDSDLDFQQMQSEK